MMQPQEIIDLLASFHQASLSKGLAFSHQQEDLEAQWSTILETRTRKLLVALLGREPTEQELQQVLSPAYPEPAYEV